MSELKRTQLYDVHMAAGAAMVDFGGWEMPIEYPSKIVAEHLYTRHACSLFDVSGDNGHAGVVGFDLLVQMGQILVRVGGVDHQEEALFLEAVEISVIHRAAPLIGDERPEHPPVRGPYRSGGQDRLYRRALGI